MIYICSLQYVPNQMSRNDTLSEIYICRLLAEMLAKQREEEERQRLEEMSEDEYDALTEEEKASVDKKRLEIKKERLRRLVTVMKKRLRETHPPRPPIIEMDKQLKTIFG